MLQLLFSMTDIVVVGKFASSNAIAAVGSNLAVQPADRLIHQYFGLARTLAWRGITASGITTACSGAIGLALLTGPIGAILIVLGALLARPMLTLMATPDEVIGQAVLYMQVYFIDMPATMIYNTGAAVLLYRGRYPASAVCFLMAAGVMNVSVTCCLCACPAWALPELRSPPCSFQYVCGADRAVPL